MLSTPVEKLQFVLLVFSVFLLLVTLTLQQKVRRFVRLQEAFPQSIYSNYLCLHNESLFKTFIMTDKLIVADLTQTKVNKTTDRLPEKY